MNTGSWAATTNNFLRIDPSGQVQVFDWVNGKPVENRTVLQGPQ
jgi:hypothetical protein